jgi:proteic killer suppression protein
VLSIDKELPGSGGGEDLCGQGVAESAKPDSAASMRKLRMLAAAVELQDLSSPPGNRLEKLSGDRAGQHSIRINNQWRICFKWNDGAEAVEVVDYHR